MGLPAPPCPQYLVFPLCASVSPSGAFISQGKLELTLELLPAKEAEERPVGRGREEPNMYPTLQPPV